jgi:hypothetical protein
MFAAWNSAREVSFRKVEKNLFVVQAKCLGDWKRIMEEGPWLFRDCALMLENFDGATTTPTVIPSKVKVWIQIHKIPPLYRTEKIVKQLASKVGEVDKVEMQVASDGKGEFHKARVNLVSTEPLRRFVTLSPEGFKDMVMQVKFEKIPKFCDYCGLMGHGVLECGTGEHEGEDLQFGEWMIAPMDTWHPTTPRVRGGFTDREAGRGARQSADRGGRTGRSPGVATGGGRGWQGAGRGGRYAGTWREKEGGGILATRKRGSDEAGLEGSGKELADTVTSPLKTVAECEADDGKAKSGAQRQLMLTERSGEKVPPPPPQYVPLIRLKRIYNFLCSMLVL